MKQGYLLLMWNSNTKPLHYVSFILVTLHQKNLEVEQLEMCIATNHSIIIYHKSVVYDAEENKKTGEKIVCDITYSMNEDGIYVSFLATLNDYYQYKYFGLGETNTSF